MSRRLVSLTLDTLTDLPHPCRDCVFWELDPAAAQEACATGDPALEKEAWISQALLEWGSCGKLIYVDDVPAGYVIYAPPSYFPRSRAFPTSPPSPDAALLTVAHVVPGYAGGGLGRMLVQGAARDLARRGLKAIEAFGDAGEPNRRYGGDAGEPGRRYGGDPGEPAGRCVVPADFFVAVGFKTVRPHPRYPRLRLELRTALTWKSDVESALEKLFDTVTADVLLGPVRPATPA
jgi:GNAT superfamily N-acetyltransferase